MEVSWCCVEVSVTFYTLGIHNRIDAESKLSLTGLIPLWIDLPRPSHCHYCLHRHFKSADMLQRNFDSQFSLMAIKPVANQVGRWRYAFDSEIQSMMTDAMIHSLFCLSLFLENLKSENYPYREHGYMTIVNMKNCLSSRKDRVNMVWTLNSNKTSFVFWIYLARPTGGQKMGPKRGVSFISTTERHRMEL